MSLIFEHKNFKLFKHQRQQNSYETDDGKIEVYRLKENLFENFKRKQKLKSFQTEESSPEEDFLKLCKLKGFCPTTDEDVIESVKNENIELMNKFHKIPNEFGIFHGENNLRHGKVITLKEHVYLIPPACKFFCKKIEDIEACLEPNETNQFDFIVVDPPWKNRYIKRVKKANKGYFMMSDDEIADIPLEKYLSMSSIVVIWCTNSETHIRAMKEKILGKWKLKLLSTWQWMKIDKNGELFNAMNGNKKPFETIFIATHKDNKSYHKELENEFVIFSQPSSVHSHKPPLLGKLFYQSSQLFLKMLSSHRYFQELSSRKSKMPRNIRTESVRKLYLNWFRSVEASKLYFV